MNAKSKKLSVVYFLLILQGNTFAELKCKQGATSGEVEGLFSKGIPKDSTCSEGETCVRFEADEITENGDDEQVEDIAVFACQSNCEESLQDTENLNTAMAAMLNDLSIGFDFKDQDLKNVKAICCTNELCNEKSVEELEKLAKENEAETNTGRNVVTKSIYSLLALAIFIVACFN